MKKEILMTLAAVAMMAGLSANQPAAAAAAAAPAAPVAVQTAPAQEKAQATLSADELAFAAKLTDQNRKVFSTQFNAEQRKAAMTASGCAASGCAAGQKVALAPNDAVQKVLGSTAVAVEKKEAPQAQTASKPAVQVK